MTANFKLTAELGYCLLVTLVCGLFCVGCGFHLRTDTLASHVSSIDVTGPSSPSIVRSLKRELTEIGVVVENPSNPDVRVLVNEHTVEKEASLLAPLGGMIEYELTLTVHYKIGLPNIDATSEGLSISATRPVKVNAENLLSTSAEDQLVRRELVDMVVVEIIRNISHEIGRPTRTTKKEIEEG